MNESTIFDKIITGEIPGYIVWQDDAHAAFLTPFANTEGMTIVVPKANPGAYIFALPEDVITNLMIATKKVANILEKAFGVERVAMVFEGEAVPHVHAKLYPMRNITADRSQFPSQTAFFPTYPGYITSIEGPKMDEAQLVRIQQKIIKAASA